MKTITFTVVLAILATLLQAQTRGTLPGEYYFSGQWYLNSQNQYVYAIWRTSDNGQTLALQYSSTTFPEQGYSMNLVSDATPGVLYATTQNKLYVSHDYAKTWMFVENTGLDGRYSAGESSGVIYKYHNSEGAKFYKSENYGLSFNLVNQTVYGFPEVGNVSNNVYILTGRTYPVYEKIILRSQDSGYNFDTVKINDEIIGSYPPLPTLTRGVSVGEVYFVSWRNAYYSIYHSENDGQTFQFKYQSEYINLFYGGAGFTAGRDPGSFLIVRGVADPTNSYMQLTIKSSSDYAQTFTTYYHELDSNYVYANIHTPENIQNVKVFPNPFKHSITIHFNSGTEIYMYNAQGQLCHIAQINVPETQVNLSHLPTGIYFYKVYSKDNRTYSGKVVKQ